MMRGFVLKPVSLGFLSSVLALAAGCGGSSSSDETMHLAGKVSYKGKPVPHGKIYFNPVQTGPAPQGFADIVNGTYDTSANNGRPAPLGTVAINVNGFDGPGGKLLFRYEVQVKLDSNTSSKDFTVPDSAATKVVDDGGPPP